jgi:hypothetical protein
MEFIEDDTPSGKSLAEISIFGSSLDPDPRMAGFLEKTTPPGRYIL